MKDDACSEEDDEACWGTALSVKGDAEACLVSLLTVEEDVGACRGSVLAVEEDTETCVSCISFAAFSLGALQILI